MTDAPELPIVDVHPAPSAPVSQPGPLRRPWHDRFGKFLRMRVINRYLFKTVLTAFAMSLLVITFIMLMGSLVQIIALIFKNVSVLVIFELLAIMLPSVICYALPFSMAAATLLVYSRLSADGEITAMKATGISIFRIAAPPLALSVLVALVALPAYNNILPMAHFKQSNIIASYRHGDTGALIETGTWTPLGKYRFFVNYKEGNMFRNITIIEDRENGLVRRIDAERGFVKNERAENRVLFELYDVTSEERNNERTNCYLRMTAGRVDMHVDMSQVFAKGQKVMTNAVREGHLTTDQLRSGIDAMVAQIPKVCSNYGKSPGQLRQDIKRANRIWAKLQRQKEWRDLLKERHVSSDQANTDIVTRKLFDVYAARLSTIGNGAGQASKLLREWYDTWPQPMHNILDTRSRFNTEIMKRLSYAFASIAFAMIGIPLGIRAHRSEKTIGFLICLVLIAIHYTLVIGVTTFSEVYFIRPDLLVWIPDLLFLATGAVLLWRIHKYA